MRPHNQYCPVAKAAEALGDRWSLLLIREMLGGVERFNELERALPGISRSVLAQRLKGLEHSGIVARRRDAAGRTVAYELTAAGRRLDPVIQVLGDWGAEELLGEPQPDELDPYLLALWYSRNVAAADRPARRVVVELVFTGKRRGRYWLVLQPDEVSLCAQHPGFPSDVVLTGPLRVLYEAYLGRGTVQGAVQRAEVSLEGPRRLTAQAVQWLGRSRYGVTD
ncbi:MAG: winged helix-turn-helix transcriptional regulator [Sporichthyaceae bacterium]